MSERDVDLARLAAAYGHRGGEAAGERAAAAAVAAALAPGSVVIDVGGGTGSHATVFAATGATVVLVDRSIEMARQAHVVLRPPSHRLPRKGGAAFAVVGDGAALPMADATADLVYFHLSVHHGPAAAWIGEAARVLRTGGMAWVWTLADLEHSFLARWFPTVGEIDRQRFLPPGEIAAVMIAAGLEGVEMAATDDTVARTAGSWVEAVRAGFVSTLHLLGTDEIEAGLESFRASHPDPAEVVSYRLAFRRVSATKPGLPS